MSTETEKTDQIAKAEDTDLTTLGDIQGTLTRPRELDPNDLAGTEDISAEDVRLPRLAIAQGLSPQMTPGDAQFIEGLAMFDMFNDLTGEVYGKGPLQFVPIRRDVRRIEFIPRAEGGGVIDLNVPANDPRLLWTKSSPEATKNDKPPAATTFIEFVVLLIRPGKAPEPIVLSIRNTNKWNRKASDSLTTFIKMRNAAIYSGLYVVDTKVPGKNDQGTFGVPTIKNNGYLNLAVPGEKLLFEYAKGFHESLVGKTIVIDREPDGVEPADEVPF